MNSSSAIGGFFELELQKGSFPHQDAILLNSGRSCFEYILLTTKPSRVHLPKYTCDAMIEPLKKLRIDYSFYSINNQLEIADHLDVKADELLVYTNYFGLKDSYSRMLAEQLGSKLVLDCSQALYFEPARGSHVFYSPRKFFGLPDGGFLYTDTKLEAELPEAKSRQLMSHLLRRIDEGAEAAYADFKANDQAISDVPLSLMSELTKSLLGAIDFAGALEKRKLNFQFLHNKLAEHNQLSIKLDDGACPMVYPFLTTDPGLRQRLIDDKIYVATYWPNVFEWCQSNELEYQLAEMIIPLPIDQRYGPTEMQRILEVIS